MRRSNPKALTFFVWLCLLTQAAAHPISGVHADISATDAAIVILLEPDADEAMHVESPDGHTAEDTLSIWLASSITLLDRFGEPIGLLPELSNGRAGVRAMRDEIEYPISIAYIPRDGAPLIPPTRLILDRTELEGVAYGVPNTGDAQRIDLDDVPSSRRPGRASATIVPTESGWAMICRAPIHALPIECRSTEGGENTQQLTQPRAKLMAACIEQRLNEAYVAQQDQLIAHPEIVASNISIPNAAADDQAPMNPYLASIEIAMRWKQPHRTHPQRVRMPLEALGQPSILVTARSLKDETVRGLVTTSDPWVSLGVREVEIGRSVNSASLDTP